MVTVCDQPQQAVMMLHWLIQQLLPSLCRKKVPAPFCKVALGRQGEFAPQVPPSQHHPEDPPRFHRSQNGWG